MAFSTHDIVPDSPTNNFCTLNPLNNPSGTFADGNLKWASPTTDQRIALSSMTIDALGNEDSYCEIYIGSKSGTFWSIGVFANPTSWDSRIHYRSDGAIFSTTTQTGLTTFTENDVMGILYDTSVNTVYFYKNGSQVASSAVPNTDYPLYIGCASDSSGGSMNYQCNFGQDPSFGGNKTSGSADAPDANGIGAFYYQPPTDALALCTANLPDFTPTVTDDVPQDYFKALIYTGNGGTDKTINCGFSPDLLWFKQRTDSSTPHRVMDTVRGVDNYLATQGTDEEFSYNYLDINNSTNDITLKASSGVAVNASNKNYVAWCWKAGGAPSGSTSTTGSAKRINTSGTQDDTSCSALATAATNAGASNVITPTLMSINQAAGFSIIKYVGNLSSNGTASLPHGLSTAPDLIITKRTNSTSDWNVFSRELNSWSHTLFLNLTNAAVDTSSSGTRNVNSSYFITNFSTGVNTNNDDHIAYCWHSVEGYSKIGSYTGNGSTDGPFVYCGFRPAFVMYKNINASHEYSSWGMIDSSRSSYNPTGGPETLWANQSTQEGYRGNGTTLIGANDFLDFDFVSNGFKLRGSGGNTETNDAQVYIFMAFSEQPFKYSNAR
jgi:hypothetical protein